MAKAPRALVVLSDPDSREAIRQILVTCGIEPVPCSTIRKARASMSLEPADVVFCETRFDDGSFEDLLRALDSSEPCSPVIVCSLYSTIRVFVWTSWIVERLTLSRSRTAPRMCAGFWVQHFCDVLSLRRCS